MYYIQNELKHIGRLTKDPQISVMQSGKKRAWLGLAIDMGKTQSGEEITEFADWTLWESSADFAERNLHKGYLIAIQGRTRTSKYDDPITMQSVKRTEFIGDTIRILGRPANVSSQNERSLNGEQNFSQTVQNEPRVAIQPSWNDDGFGNPLGIRDEDLPF